MIVNDSLKFLFVHIHKTAGTSITINLAGLEGTYLFENHHSLYNKEEGKFRDYFKFCFVRNPWARIFSWYNMMKSKGVHNAFSAYLLENDPDFSTFLTRTGIVMETYPEEIKTNNPYPKSISFNQLDFITDKSGKILVNFIGRFENLEADYQQVQRIIGFDNPLGHHNKFGHDHYRRYYSDKDIERVYKLYKRDIDYFGYTF